MAKYQEEKPFKNPAYITILKVFIITLHLNNTLKFTKYFHNFSYFFFSPYTTMKSRLGGYHCHSL